jgi:hypothetical protein
MEKWGLQRVGSGRILAAENHLAEAKKFAGIHEEQAGINQNGR